MNKEILSSYELNKRIPSDDDLDIAMAVYFLQGGKIRPSALVDIFGEDSSELKDWENITSENADKATVTFDSASTFLCKALSCLYLLRAVTSVFMIALECLSRCSIMLEQSLYSLRHTVLDMYL